MMACILVLDKIYGRFACTQDDLMKRITSGMSSVPIGRRHPLRTGEGFQPVDALVVLPELLEPA